MIKEKYMTSTNSKLIANYILCTLLIALCGFPGRALSQAQPKADSGQVLHRPRKRPLPIRSKQPTS